MSTDIPGRRDVGNPAVDLRANLDGLMDEARRLRVDVHDAEQARRRYGHINLGLTALLAVLVALVLAIGWQNNQVAREVQATNARMADCTTPGGTCYEQGRARTESAVGALTKISIYVSQCGRLYPGESGPEFDRKLERCVAEKLGQPQPTPSPSGSPR